MQIDFKKYSNVCIFFFPDKNLNNQGRIKILAGPNTYRDSRRKFFKGLYFIIAFILCFVIALFLIFDLQGPLFLVFVLRTPPI